MHETTFIKNKNHKIFSPAKINLFLHITGKRGDGYHTLISLMCSVGLCDILFFSFDAEKLRVFCNHPLVPDGETNLVFLAAELFMDRFGQARGIEIILEKKIPVGAGLGGGSSNAASVLLFLNQYYGYPFGMAELISMGASLGSDVPFFIFQKPAIVAGTGEKLVAYDGIGQLYALIIYPGFSISTSMIYKDFDLGLTNSEKKVKSYTLNSHTIKSPFDPRAELVNDLEDVAVLKYPEIGRMKDALLANRAINVLMTGSGSAVFGLFSDFEAVKKAEHELLKCSGWQVYVAQLLV